MTKLKKDNTTSLETSRRLKELKQRVVEVGCCSGDYCTGMEEHNKRIEELISEVVAENDKKWEGIIVGGNYYRKMPDGSFYSVNSLSELLTKNNKTK